MPFPYRRPRALLFLFLLLPLLGPPPLFAIDPVKASGEVRKAGIDAHFEVLADPTHKLKIDDILTPRYSSAFIPNERPGSNYGRGPSAYWIRFAFDNDSASDVQWVLRLPYLWFDWTDFFIPRVSGGYDRVRVAGYGASDRDRDVQDRGPGFFFSQANFGPAGKQQYRGGERLFHRRFDLHALLAVTATVQRASREVDRDGGLLGADDHVDADVGV